MMTWFKSFAAIPFSDLWLPSVLIGACIIATLGLHHLYLQWQAQRLARKLNQAPQAQAMPSPTMSPSKRSQLSDIHAFTAQRQPVALEEQPNIETEYVPTTLIVPESFDPDFDRFDESDGFARLEALSPVQFNLNQAKPNSPAVGAAVDEAVFFKPHPTVLLPKPPAPVAPALHPVLHYQARLTWRDAQGKQVLSEVLQAYPWTHPLPVVITPDAQDDCSVIIAWLVASRRELASSQDAAAFKQWCEQLANRGGARCEMVATSPWDAFLDEAHSLLIGLDSVIVLKVAVPLVQLDLFAQSLLAARFTQSQEHWCYQEQAHSTAIYLERMWQQGSAEAAMNQQAVFQLIIDIPHLDALEARKIYMRLRAVARASAAIVQSAQGVHLSEGMLDRYSRELMMKQEALTQAQVLPGSALAKQVYKPQLLLNRDLALN